LVGSDCPARAAARTAAFIAVPSPLELAHCVTGVNYVHQLDLRHCSTSLQCRADTAATCTNRLTRAACLVSRLADCVDQLLKDALTDRCISRAGVGAGMRRPPGTWPSAALRPATPRSAAAAAADAIVRQQLVCYDVADAAAAAAAAACPPLNLDDDIL